MNGTFKQQSQDAQAKAYEERKQIRLLVIRFDNSNLTYRIGMEIPDPWTEETTEITDLVCLTPDKRFWEIALKTGTHMTIEAVAWRILDHNAGDTENHG